MKYCHCDSCDNAANSEAVRLRKVPSCRRPVRKIIYQTQAQPNPAIDETQKHLESNISPILQRSEMSVNARVLKWLTTATEPSRAEPSQTPHLRKIGAARKLWANLGRR
jgi:hypothetical protein